MQARESPNINMTRIPTASSCIIVIAMIVAVFPGAFVNAFVEQSNQVLNGEIFVNASETNLFRIDYVVASEFFSDRQFAIALFVFDNSSSKVPHGLDVRLIGSPAKAASASTNNISSGKTCFVPYLIWGIWGVDPKVRGSEIRRLNLKTILLVIRHIDDQPSADGQSAHRQVTAKLLLLNMQNCRYDIIHDAGDLPSKIDIFIDTNDEMSSSFAIIAQDDAYCAARNVSGRWCRLFFDPMYRKTEALRHFDFSWDELVFFQPIDSYDSNVFVVRLIDHTGNRVSVYNLSASSIHNDDDDDEASHHKHLYAVQSNEPGNDRFKTFSGGLSYCWTDDLTFKAKSFHCSSFQKNGTVTISDTLVYEEFRMIAAMQSIPNGFAVFCGRILHDCSRIECLHQVKLTIVTSSGGIQHRHLQLKCPLLTTLRQSTWGIRYKQTNDGLAVEVHYICAFGDYVSYQTIFVTPLFT